MAGRRREALGMARDQAVLRERVVMKELQEAALEQAQRQRAREEEEEGVKRRRAELKRLAQERRARYEAAFGVESLFGGAFREGSFWEGMEPPVGAQEVGIAGLEGLAALRVQGGWQRRGMGGERNLPFG